ncbi:PUA-like domain-containing protein, partial [Suillus ampliporus]
MDLFSAPERGEDIHSCSDTEIEEDREEIASKESKKVRVSPAMVALVMLLSVSPSIIALTHFLYRQQFGARIPVGTTWKTRRDCCDAGVHRPLSAGIHGTKKKGCFSVVVSCYYEDDKDFGDIIYYTGAVLLGGRINNGWSAGPQARDQRWTDWGNEALLKSRDTDKPVHVVRSHKFVSKYSPWDGYRYDGLYTVTRAWQEKNSNDLDICRFKLTRVPGQPPLPHRSPLRGHYIQQPSSPASVATSESDKTVVSPSGTSIAHKRDVCSSEPERDHASVPSKKRKLADRQPSPTFPASSSSFICRRQEQW